MEINQLTLLDVIVNRKSFKKAAEQCFVSTSTLTRQVTAMEAEIGFPIFERSASGVTLTEQGEVFYRRTQAIPKLYENAVASARQTGRETWPVRVSIFGYLREHVTHACAEMMERDPTLDFSFVSCQLLETLPALIDRRVDIFLLTDVQDADERLFVLPIFRTRNCVIVSRNHPLAGRHSVRMAELDGQTVLESVKKPASGNCLMLKRLLEHSCPHIAFREYTHPDQADALCQVDGFPIASLGFLEPPEGFRRVLLADAPPVLIGAACRREDRPQYRPIMERFRDIFLCSANYARAKEEGGIL